MKITEQKLLDGYIGLAEGLDIISEINGTRVWWTYRNIHGATCGERDPYGSITLCNDRIGEIDQVDTALDPFGLCYDGKLTQLQLGVLQAIAVEYERAAGVEV